MNYVKGAALSTIPEIIKKDFNENGLNQWMEELSGESRDIFSRGVSAKDWYPLESGLIEPTVKYCALFHNWDYVGAWRMGRYSADFGLKTSHKIFLKIGSPQFLIKRASKILPSYYKISRLTLDKLENDGATLTVTDFPGINKVIKFRIGGWMERALEISGCRGVKVDVEGCDQDDNPSTEIRVSWEN